MTHTPSNEDSMTIRGAVKMLIAYSGVLPENEEAFVKFIEYKMHTLVEAVDEYQIANARLARTLQETVTKYDELVAAVEHSCFVPDGDTEELQPVQN